MFELNKEVSFLYPTYVLVIVSMGYFCGELGHFLIGVTSKKMAEDLHYGDITCQLNMTDVYLSDLPIQCSEAKDSHTCATYAVNGTRYCEWTYNGLGLDYQILAGPSFIAVFTVVGVLMGFLADKFNRVKLLTICIAVVGIAIILTGTVKKYWQLVLLRIILAAGDSGCSPLATGILSDMFPKHNRALVISVFNLGIYGAYGVSFPLGHYGPQMNAFDLHWKMTYYVVGIVALIFAVLIWFTLSEPERKPIEEIAANLDIDVKNDKKLTIWNIIKDPRIIMLCFAASIRQTGSMCLAYNCHLYYQTYFPDYDLQWWLFIDIVGVGFVGVIVGGFFSDKFVVKMGIRSRCIVLGVSQIISTPFAFGSLYFTPTWAMITLGVSYFFGFMWFGIILAMLVEIVPLNVRSTSIGVFFFVINNIGGNLPIAVEPVSKKIGYRESLYIFYVAAYGLSSILFLLTTFLMPAKEPAPKANNLSGDDNAVFTGDDTNLP